MTIRPATPDDLPIILELIKDLAEYERAPHEVEATVDSLRETLFTQSPVAFCEIVEHKGEPAGMAIWFLNYSTWQAKPGIYLEDLYIKPEFRGEGYGKALLVHLAQKCVERGYGRFQWWVLDWNTPATDFYGSMGAVPMDEWTVWRLQGEALELLATEGR
jgi:GNAT superfamily N-acetyltransferase